MLPGLSACKVTTLWHYTDLFYYYYCCCRLLPLFWWKFKKIKYQHPIYENSTSCVLIVDIEIYLLECTVKWLVGGEGLVYIVSVVVCWAIVVCVCWGCVHWCAGAGPWSEGLRSSWLCVRSTARVRRDCTQCLPLQTLTRPRCELLVLLLLWLLSRRFVACRSYRRAVSAEIALQ